MRQKMVGHSLIIAGAHEGPFYGYLTWLQEWLNSPQVPNIIYVGVYPGLHGSFVAWLLGALAGVGCPIQ